MSKKNYLWDIFLAHAGADAPAAGELYSLLEPDCKVFLDNRCLKLGDDWDIELSQAQQVSRITVVLVSSRTEKAYYQREEIAAAIDMARKNKDQHRVIPVYLDGLPDDSSNIPYGLRLKHGISAPDVGGLSKVAQNLLSLLKQLDDLSKYIYVRNDDPSIAILFKESFQDFKNAREWVSNKKVDTNFLGLAGQQYTQQLESRYGILRIFGMSKPVKLRNIYTRVNILEKITALQQVSVEELESFFDHDRRGFGIKRETVEGIEVVNKLSKFIVLGKPGAGKTTFLRYIALQSADGALNEDLIPIFIGLKDLSDSGKTLRHYIDKQFQVCNLPDISSFTEHLLSRGKCILLLDGLDEVSKTKEDEVISQIRNLSDIYSRNQFILSCRIAAYNYCFEQFTDVEMADFTDEQIRAFIDNWFGGGSKKAIACWKEVERNLPIKELASIPLLLTLLCLAFDETMDFPQNRAELYKDALDALLKKWDSSRNIKREEVYKNLSLRRKESLFSRIAETTFENDQYFIPRRMLETYIADFIQHLPDVQEKTLEFDSEAVLKAIEAQHGIFVERARGIYSFSHLTFQEYFTAKHLVDNAKKGSLEALLINQLTNDKWREVFLIISGMLEDAEDFLTLLKKQIQSQIEDKLCILLKVVQKSIEQQADLYTYFVNKNVSPVCLRASILTFALARILDRDRDLDLSLSRTLTSEFDQNLRASLKWSAFTKSKTRFIDRVRTQDRPQAVSRARSRALALARSIDLARAVDQGQKIIMESTIDLDHSLHYAIDLDFDLILDNALALDQTRVNDLNDDLAHAIAQAANLEQPIKLENAIDRVFRLEDDFIEKIVIYLKATYLLVSCLQTECYVSKNIRRQLWGEVLTLP